MRPPTKYTYFGNVILLDYHRTHYSVVLDDTVIGRIDIINSRMFKANGNLYDRLYMAAREMVRRKVGEG